MIQKRSYDPVNLINCCWHAQQCDIFFGSRRLDSDHVPARSAYTVSFVQISIRCNKKFEDADSECPYDLPCLQRRALHASAKSLLPNALQRGDQGCGKGGLNLLPLQLLLNGHWVMPPQRDLSMLSCAAVVAFSLIQIVFFSKQVCFFIQWVCNRTIVPGYDGAEFDIKIVKKEGLRKVWHPLQYLSNWQNLMSNLLTNRYSNVNDAWEHTHALEMLPSQECHYTTWNRIEYTLLQLNACLSIKIITAFSSRTDAHAQLHVCDGTPFARYLW